MSEYVNYLNSILDEDSSLSSTSSFSKRPQKRPYDHSEEEPGTLTPTPVKRQKYPLRGGAQSPQNRPRPHSNSSHNEENGSVSETDPGEGTSRGPVNQQNLNKLPQAPFQQGTNIYSDSNVRIQIQSIEHQRHTRFRAEDHLFQINIYPNRRSAPLLLSLETALQNALLEILHELKKTYSHEMHHQIYLTIIEQNILHGLNTGNYDLSAPPREIVNRALTILHSYLKSNQTMKLNDSFKIQIKILSQNHTRHAQKNNPRLKKRIFRDYAKIRNYIRLRG